jgi:putative DNA primase/helicase
LKPPDANLILREQGADALRSVFDNTPPEPPTTSVQPNTGGGAVPEIELDFARTASHPSAKPNGVGRRLKDYSLTSMPRPRRRPTIILRVGETEGIVDEIETALIASARGLYQRGGFIVAAGFDRMPTWDGRTVELQVIEERGDFALLEDIEAVAQYVKPARTAKVGCEKFKLCAPPIALARTLKQRRHRLRLPTLVGIVNCPFIKANGELVTKPGFDPKTGILFAAGGAAFPSIPDRPAKGDAERALARLRRLIATFDFVTPDDEAVALSLILTAISRPAMPFAPLHGFTAPVAGAGKSMLVDIASILATCHEAGVAALNGNLEEAHKHLSALLMRGDQIIALDNCEHPLEGVLLNQTLTHRALVGRLDPKVARPELREFDYDPIDDAKTNRCELVTAALTVLRAYHVAGRPNRVPPLDSFREWSKTVREPLLWLDAGDPVKTMERTRKTDPVLRSLRGVMRAWFEAFTVSPATARMATAEADSRPALHDALMAVVGRAGKVEGRMFGNWLAKHSDRVVDIADEGAEPAFFAFEQAGDRSGVALWRLAERQK